MTKITQDDIDRLEFEQYCESCSNPAYFTSYGPRGSKAFQDRLSLDDLKRRFAAQQAREKEGAE